MVFFFEILNSLNKQISTLIVVQVASLTHVHTTLYQNLHNIDKTKQLSRNKVNRMIIMLGFLNFKKFTCL